MEILARIFPRGIVLLLLAVAGMAASGARAQSPREYQVKAVCLWRLAQYVQWPTNSFPAGTNTPIVIGVLGDNPFGNALQLAVKGEKAQGHPIQVRYFNRAQDALDAHILFLSRTESRQVSEDLFVIDDRSILTVSDIDKFVRSYRGMVGISVEQGKLRLRINPDAALAAHLTIDAHLLRISEIVR